MGYNPYKKRWEAMESLANEAFRDALTDLVLWLIGVYVQLPGPLRELTDRVILENIGFFLNVLL